MQFLSINEVPGPSTAWNVAWKRHARPILHVAPQGVHSRRNCEMLSIHLISPPSAQ